jgi:hypothetical protein
MVLPSLESAVVTGAGGVSSVDTMVPGSERLLRKSIMLPPWWAACRRVEGGQLIDIPLSRKRPWWQEG